MKYRRSLNEDFCLTQPLSNGSSLMKQSFLSPNLQMWRSYSLFCAFFIVKLKKSTLTATLHTKFILLTDWPGLLQINVKVCNLDLAWFVSPQTMWYKCLSATTTPNQISMSVILWVILPFLHLIKWISYNNNNNTNNFIRLLLLSKFTIYFAGRLIKTHQHTQTHDHPSFMAASNNKP